MTSPVQQEDSGENSMDTLCMACTDAGCDFKPTVLPRREPGELDVVIDVHFVGVCHSDLHHAASHMNKVMKVPYPSVPGHEIAGIVSAVGSKVTKFKVGDHAGVGCMVDSCLSCSKCKSGEEQKCVKQSTGTYGAKNKHGRAASPTGYTLGGYTDKFVCTENFVVSIPKDYPLEAAGPIFCAAITMYDPLKAAGVGPGSKVGIAGLGGLGQMGVRLAKALGAQVSVFSRSAGKEASAKEFGADKFVVYTDEAQVKENLKSLDLILNTVPAYHDYCFFNKFLNKNGQQVILGLHEGIAATMLAAKFLPTSKPRVIHSGIGGMVNTQEVMDLCAKNNIVPKTKLFPVWELNSVFELLDQNNDEGIRYVMDIKGTLNKEASEKCESVQAPTLKPAHSPFSQWSIAKELTWYVCTGKWL